MPVPGKTRSQHRPDESGSSKDRNGQRFHDVKKTPWRGPIILARNPYGPCIVLEELPVYLATGAAAGVLAGLLGVGGGLIIVPALYFLLQRNGVSTDAAMQIAVGTSLATIVVTSISSVLAHHRRGAVRWSVVARLTPGMLAGALIGSLIADYLPSAVLARVFAVFAVLVGLSMLLSREVHGHAQLPRAVGLLSAGTIIGVVSALVGIGGGSMTVPFLSWCRVAIHQAVATSAGCGLPIALAGTAGFVALGWSRPDLPPHSLGYVLLPAAAGIAAVSVFAAIAGAALAHRLNTRVLKRVFGVFLTLLGLYMMLGSQG